MVIIVKGKLWVRITNLNPLEEWQRDESKEVVS